MNQTLADLLKGIAAGLLLGADAGITDQLVGDPLRHSLLIGASVAIGNILLALGWGQVQGARARSAALQATRPPP